MEVFLTGATGFVGKHVAARLIADGHEVKCVVRRPDSPGADYLRSIGAELARGDILDADSLAEAARGADAVIHLVAVIFESRGATFEDVHIRGTMNTLAAASVAGASRFVYMSALGAGPDAVSAYLRSKWECEEAVRESGLGYTIFRPSIIYGTGGEFIHMMVSQVKLLPVIPVVGNGRYRMQPVSVLDVAACISSCLENSRTMNQAYELGGPEPLTYNEMIDCLCRVLGKRRLKFHVPLPLMRVVASVAERMQSKPLITSDQIRMLLVDNVCDISRVRADFGLDPAGFEDGLKEMPV